MNEWNVIALYIHPTNLYWLHTLSESSDKVSDEYINE